MSGLNAKSLKTAQHEMRAVWDSWDYHMFEKVQALDHIVRCIMSDMCTAGVPAVMATTFLQDQFKDQLEQITKDQSA